MEDKDFQYLQQGISLAVFLNNNAGDSISSENKRANKYSKNNW